MQFSASYHMKKLKRWTELIFSMRNLVSILWVVLRNRSLHTRRRFTFEGDICFKEFLPVLTKIHLKISIRSGEMEFSYLGRGRLNTWVERVSYWVRYQSLCN